jgi:hypothetical protein
VVINLLMLLFVFNIITIVTTIIMKDITSVFTCVSILMCVFLYLFENKILNYISLIVHFSSVLYLVLFIISYSPTTPYFLFLLIIDAIFFIYYAIICTKIKATSESNIENEVLQKEDICIRSDI